MEGWNGLAGPDRNADGDLLELAPVEPTPSRWRVVGEIPILVVIAAAMAIVFKSFVAQAFYIPSVSMAETLEVGDRVIVSRLAYRLHDPRRGDVVVFQNPTRPSPGSSEALPIRLGREVLEGLGAVQADETDLIKRVVGLPGEHVMARDGRVIVDGRLLIEPYLEADSYTSNFDVTVPEGHVFVLGDNRANSSDSRALGPVPTDLIVGRALFRLWPPGRAGYL